MAERKRVKTIFYGQTKRLNICKEKSDYVMWSTITTTHPSTEKGFTRFKDVPTNQNNKNQTKTASIFFMFLIIFFIFNIYITCVLTCTNVFFNCFIIIQAYCAPLNQSGDCIVYC